MAQRIDPWILVDKQINQWYINEYLGEQKFRCTCSCGKEKVVRKYELINGTSKSCGHEKFEDLKDKQIGEWKVLEYIGNKQYMCECSCGTIKPVYAHYLKNGQSKSCGHRNGHNGEFQDLKDKQFGEWTVIDYAGDSFWNCRCSCGKLKKVKSITLRDGRSKSCGHGYNEFKDLTDMQIGHFKVIKYLDNQRWLCKCSCNKIVVKSSKSLREATPNSSCGHTKIEVAQNNSKITRTDLQKNAVISERNLREFIGNNKYKMHELSDLLGITYSHTVRLCNQYNIDDLLIKNSGTSMMEEELYNYIREITPSNIEIQRNVRDIIKGELDIYIPDYKLAIEFNGNYWHSTVYKHKKYHQDKTVQCLSKGIHLVHVFEYEWIDDTVQLKIKDLLNTFIGNNTRVYARDCTIKCIGNEEARDFLELNHLQGSTNAKINLALVKDVEILSVMTFGIPRFDNNYEYELIRLATKSGVNVIGGSEKLFKYFISKYNPKSILSYCNVSKFSGKVYEKMGFSKIGNLTTPNYIWLYNNDNTIISRYMSQKHKLIEKGYGDESQTEDEIMTNLGFLKIYDSGNLKLEWYKTS